MGFAQKILNGMTKEGKFQDSKFKKEIPTDGHISTYGVEFPKAFYLDCEEKKSKEELDQKIKETKERWGEKIKGYKLYIYRYSENDECYNKVYINS